MNRPIYICTPVDEDKKESKERAHRAARYFRLSGTAISPVLALSYLDENDWLYKPLSLELIDMCKAMCVFADEVTEHMIAEIKRAKELGIPIKFYDADSNEIDYDALVINKRIGPGYRKMIMDAHGDTCGNGLCPYSGAPCAKGDAVVASEQVPAEQHTADAVTPEETSIITKLLGWLFTPMASGIVKAKTGDDTTDAVYQNWYSAVYLPTEPEPVVVQSTRSASKG